LVAVHGNGGGGFRFHRVREHIIPDIRFEAVTLPGFGGRPADPSLVTLEDYAEQLWSEISGLPGPLVVLGHGIGGSIALDMVQRHPVDGLIIHAPVGTRLDERLFPKLMKPEPVRALVKWGISSKWTRPLTSRVFFSSDVPPNYRDEFLSEYARAASFSQMFDVITSEWWAGLRPVDVPAVLLWGSEDRVLGADQVDDYRRLLPRASVDVVPGWGHFPMVEQPAEYAATVTAIVQRLIAGEPAPLRLGSGSGASFGVGAKAAMLDQALAAGLPVPSGFVIPDGQEPSSLLDLSGPFAVRSAFSVEDTDASSNAGRFRSLLGVNSDGLSTAVGRVRSSAGTDTGRLDVLVMDMVRATTAGIAFTERGFEDDRVEWVHGLAADLASGNVAGASMELARLRAGEQPRRDLAGWQRRLALLLRDVRAEFGDFDWDVEWADDGETCWLLQVRPITAPTLRNETFTIANHKEILPDPPSVFMTSVIAEGSSELFDYYRMFDRELSDRRDFIEVFDGRPLINLSLMTDFMRSLGLPPKLVTDSIGGTDRSDARLRPKRMLRRLPVLIRLALAQVTAQAYTRRKLSEIRALTSTRASSFHEAVDRLREVYVRTVHGMTALNTAASAPTALLRAAGTLGEHSSRSETTATRMFRDLASVGRAAGGDFDPDAPPFEAPGFNESWARWLDEYGHRGIFESDISRPRYVEDPAPILHSIPRASKLAHRPQRWTAAGVLTLPIWMIAKPPISAREQYRSDAMAGFLSVRRDLLHLAADIGLRPDDLWLLEADEVRALDDGWRPAPDVLRLRRMDQHERRVNPIPDVIRRFDPPAIAERSDSFTGVGLAKGTVEGTAWVLSEPATHLPDGLDPETTVLVATSVEAGWLPTFGLVSGVAVEIGGDLSHGSIILREVGLPAATNLTGVHGSVRTGDRVRLDATRGRLDVLDRQGT
jgi:pyruvate,water dikinase